MEKAKEEQKKIFNNFFDNKKEDLNSKINDLIKFIKDMEEHVNEHFKNGNAIEAGRRSPKATIEKLKKEADTLSILPTIQTILNRKREIEKLANIGELDLRDNEEFLIRFANSIKRQRYSEEEQNELKDRIKEFYRLNNEFDLNSNELKEIIKIYIFSIRNNRDILKLVNNYRYKLFRRNLKKILLVYEIGFNNGFEFKFINSHIIELLSITYLERSGVSVKTVKNNILHSMNLLKENKKLDFEDIFSKIIKQDKGKETKINRGNKNIDLEFWCLIKIAVGNIKAKNSITRLQAVNDFFDGKFTKQKLNQILRLQEIKEKKKENELLKIIENKNSFKEKITKELQVNLNT